MTAIHINPSIIKIDKTITKEQRKQLLDIRKKVRKSSETK